MRKLTLAYCYHFLTSSALQLCKILTFACQVIPGLSKTDFAMQVARTLRSLWELGWIHGDVSPGNIVFANGQATLIDLATARCPSGKVRNHVCMLDQTSQLLPKRSSCIVTVWQYHVLLWSVHACGAQEDLLRCNIAQARATCQLSGCSACTLPFGRWFDGDFILSCDVKTSLHAGVTYISACAHCIALATSAMDQCQVTQTLSMTIHLNPVPPLKDVVHYFRSGSESIGMVGNI